MDLTIPLIFVVALLAIGWIASQPYLREYRRGQIRQRPFPAEWDAILRRYMPYFRALPGALRQQLKQHMQVFIAEKEFIGCNGLVVTDAMRVTIAGYACLLILNRRADYYPQLRQILIYPGAFVVDTREYDEAGVLHEEREVRIGESWTRGQVILSWHDAVEDAKFFDDGRNVLIHEFAHQLDQETGTANGAPILADDMPYQSWSAVLADEFERLQQRELRGEESLFSYYGATNPAEFFAVISEVFFEQPRALAAQHPELYRQLAGFYRLDPLAW